MGSELLTEEEAAPPKIIYTDKFYEVFPFYLSIGMTYEQFWLEDANLAKYYREAFEMQRERANHDAWLQGAYFYDALCAVAPILHAFAKKGTKPQPYLDKPYPMKRENVKQKKKKPADNGALRGAAMFHAFAEQFNKKFSVSVNERHPADEGGDVNNGGND